MLSGNKHAADHNTSVCKLRPLGFGKSIKKGQVINCFNEEGFDRRHAVIKIC